MAKKPAAPPFPHSPGDWIACFRHRVQVDGRTLSPEEFAKLIDRSGATVRRWEQNRQIPDERDIARMSKVCDLSPHQTAFLSAACTRMRAMPAPDRAAYHSYMGDLLTSTAYPAMILDGLFYVRAWNSYIDALAPGATDALLQDLHPMAMMMRADAGQMFGAGQRERIVGEGLRIFWMTTAVHSHRPEYAATIARLELEPRFRDLWMDLALSRHQESEPVTFVHALVSDGPRFKVFSRIVTFPPTYYVNEYQPDDDAALERLQRMRESGPPVARFKRDLHWVNAYCSCGCQ